MTNIDKPGVGRCNCPHLSSVCVGNFAEGQQNPSTLFLYAILNLPEVIGGIGHIKKHQKRFLPTLFDLAV